MTRSYPEPSAVRCGRRKAYNNSMTDEEERALRPMKIDPLPKHRRNGERYQQVKKTKPRRRRVGSKGTKQC